MIFEDILAMFGVSCFVVGSSFGLWFVWIYTRAEPFRCILCDGEIEESRDVLGATTCHDCAHPSAA